MEDLVFGTWIQSASPVVAELMAMCGFDFVAIDLEHSPVDIEKAFSLLQAIKSGNPKCKAYLRLSENNYYQNKRFMDAGADGLICPMIESKDQVSEFINSIKYYPKGKRGVGYSRSNDYGLNILNSLNEDNKNSFACIQIEDVKAIDHLEEILSVDGLDAAMIGPYDLSSSMGIPGQFEHKKMIEAENRFLKYCSEKAIKPGIHIIDLNPDLVKFKYDEGYRLIVYSVDVKMISEYSIEALSKLKK